MQDTALRKHRAGKWEITKMPTAYTSGTQAKHCKACGIVLSVRSIRFSKRYFAEAFSLPGLDLADYLPGFEPGKYLIIPLDLSGDSAMTLPLIADGGYAVGSITLVVADGRLTISSSLGCERTEILKYAFRLYPDISDITPQTLAKRSRIRLEKPFRLSTALRQAACPLLIMECKGILDRASAENMMIAPHEVAEMVDSLRMMAEARALTPCENHSNRR